MKEELTLLTTFELAVVSKMLEGKAPDILEHLTCLRVRERQFTGAGMYVHFTYVGEGSQKARITKTFKIEANATIEGIPNDGGFILYIDAGCISTLEAYTYGSDVWPSHVDRFEIVRVF